MNDSTSFAMQWYKDEQVKKKKQLTGQKVSRINQNLKQILQRIQTKEIRTELASYAKKYGAYVQQASIWNINYRNNLENPKVALGQAVLIQLIIMKSEKREYGSFEHQVNCLMKELNFATPGIEIQYRRELQIAKNN